MNIARFTLSLTLLSSVVAPAFAHKDGCSHDCKHESLHPTKKNKTSTTSHTEKETDTKSIAVAQKIEIIEPIAADVSVAAKLAEPVTVTTVSAPTHAVEAAAITPIEIAPAIEVAKAPEIAKEATPELEIVALAEAQDNVEELVVAQVEEAITIASVDTASQSLSEEEKEKRRQFADLRPEDINATIEEIAKLLEDEELILSSIDDAAPADIKTAAAPTPEAAEAQEDINNLTQVMI